MTVSVILGDGLLATQDLTAAFANYVAPLRLLLPYRNLSYWFHEGADGFKTEILKTILSMEIQQCGDVRRKLNFYVLLSLFFFCYLSLCRSLSLSVSCSVKYAKYLESYSVEGVRHIFKKACTIHLPKKPTVHLLWAAFEEQQGKTSDTLSNW